MAEDGPASTGRGMPDMSSPTKIAEAATRIYDEEFKEEYEKVHRGRYVVIDVRTGTPYLGDSSDGALENARTEAPHGLFHLIRVGSRSAFKATRSANPQDNRLWAS